MDEIVEDKLRELLTLGYGCKKVNTRTGGPTKNWKIVVYERSNWQVAFYDKKTIHLVLERYDDVIPNVRRAPRAEGSQKLKKSLNVHVEVESFEDAKLILADYFKFCEFEDYASKFEGEVAGAGADSTKNRRARLSKASKEPVKRTVSITVYDRNPDVVAEVLEQAKGHCGECGSPAPFKRAKNGQPYLEVHHKVHLANGGEDTVENAIALCPNCHREVHYGVVL